MSRIHDPKDREEIHPVAIKEYPGFYYYPQDGNVGVSSDGRIINLREGKEIKVTLNLSKGKAVVSLPFYLENDKKTWKTFSYHRVLAETFIGRPTIHKHIPLTLLQVNHINCDKNDNSIGNLEWCTGLENINHSFNSDNSSQQHAVETKNIVTGDIRLFRSITEAAAEFNICGSTLSTLLKKYSGELQNGDWIFKYQKDKKGWRAPMYRIDEEKIAQAIDIKSISTGEIRSFNTLDPVSRFLGINYFTLAQTVREDRLAKCRCGDWILKKKNDEEWPNIGTEAPEIGAIRNKQIAIKDLDTGEIIEFNTLASCYKYLSITEGRMRAYVDGKNYLDFRLGKYIIKLANMLEWPKVDMNNLDYPVNRSVGIHIKNIHTGEITAFESISEASKALNLKKGTLGNALLNRLNYKYLYGDYVVRLSDKEWPTLRLGAPTIRTAIVAKEVKVHDIEKKHITLFPTINSACEFLGTDKNKIIRGLKNTDSMRLNQYIVSYI